MVINQSQSQHFISFIWDLEQFMADICSSTWHDFAGAKIKHLFSLKVGPHVVCVLRALLGKT